MLSPAQSRLRKPSHGRMRMPPTSRSTGSVLTTSASRGRCSCTNACSGSSFRSRTCDEPFTSTATSPAPRMKSTSRGHLVPPRTAAEQVRLAALQLARARSAQDEPQTTVLDEPVDLVQKLRHLLHLIDDHRLGTTCAGWVSRRSRSSAGRLSRAMTKSESSRSKAETVGESVVQVGRLAALAGAPQECRLPLRQINVEQSSGSRNDGNELLICQANTDQGPRHALPSRARMHRDRCLRARAHFSHAQARHGDRLTAGGRPG